MTLSQTALLARGLQTPNSPTQNMQLSSRPRVRGQFRPESRTAGGACGHRSPPPPVVPYPRIPLRTREGSLPACCGEHRPSRGRDTQVGGVNREVLDCGCFQDGVQFPGPGQVPLKHGTFSLMSLGEPGTHQCQVHAKPTHREGNTERVLVAVAPVPGLDDTSQNDPDCAGVLVVTGYRAQVPQ